MFLFFSQIMAASLYWLRDVLKSRFLIRWTRQDTVRAVPSLLTSISLTPLYSSLQLLYLLYWDLLSQSYFFLCFHLLLPLLPSRSFDLLFCLWPIVCLSCTAFYGEHSLLPDCQWRDIKQCLQAFHGSFSPADAHSDVFMDQL